MPRWPRRGRRSPDVAELARVVVAEMAKAGMAIPAGATVVDATQARAMAQSMGPTGPFNALSREGTFDGLFGPNRPLVPAPIDPTLPTGRTSPRLSQFPVAWNLQITSGKLVPFSVLRDVADNCDLVRRCIEIRKAGMTGMEWNITTHEWVVERVMVETGEKIRARAAAIARDRYVHQIDALRRFWETPDRLNRLSMADWMSMLMEEQLVTDAVTVYPHPAMGASPVDGITTGLHSFELLDGSTIKALLDSRGGVPQPPAPAYQQILYGFPRGEFVAADPDQVDGEWGTDDLFYRPRNRRAWTPYGLPPTEQVLPIVDVYLKRQEWLRAEYGAGATPNTWLQPVGPNENWTPEQRRMWEMALNADLSGQTEARHQIHILPPFLHPVETTEFGEKYRAEFDEHLIKMIGSFYDVMPTQLGIVPRMGLGGRGHQEGEEDKWKAMAEQPTLEWLTDLLNDLSITHLGMPPELTFVFSGEKVEDALDHIQGRQVELASGQTTLNQMMGDLGRPLYDFAEADMPFVVTTSGLIFIEGASQTAPSPQLPDRPLPHVPGDRPLPPADGPTAGDSTTTPATEEAKKFVAFATRQIKAGKWRDFAFAHVDADTARMFNEHGGNGRIDAIKVLAASLPKAPARHWPGWEIDHRIAAHYAPLLARAFAGILDAAELARRWLALRSKAANPDDLAAAASFLTDVTNLDPGQAVEVLRALYGDAYVAGDHVAARMVSAAGGGAGIGSGNPVSVVADRSGVATSIDWGNWSPGDPAAAELVSALAEDRSIG
ncbi:MAG: hypothetical protein ACYDAD_11700, partial [Acidimicrobiales bacterium]